MKLEIDQIINMWNEINDDIDPPCLLESLKVHCTTTSTTNWRLLFTSSLECKKVVKHFIDIGGSVLVSTGCTSTENVVHARICKMLRPTSPEYKLVVGFMAKIYEILNSGGLQIESLLGKEAAKQYGQLKLENSAWQLDLSPSIMSTTIQGLSGISDGQKFLEKAIFYLELANSHYSESGKVLDKLLAMANSHLTNQTKK